MRLILRSAKVSGFSSVEVYGVDVARYQKYTSFAPRFFRLCSVDGRWCKYVSEEGKGARSRIKRAGCEEMVPRRIMRRPASSVKLVVK